MTATKTNRTKTTLHAELPNGQWAKLSTSANHRFVVIAQYVPGVWSVVKWAGTSDAAYEAMNTLVPQDGTQARIVSALSAEEKDAIIRLREGADMQEIAAELVAMQPVEPDAEIVPEVEVEVVSAPKRKRTAAEKRSRNATVPNPSPLTVEELGPRTVITVEMTSVRGGIISGPGWTGVLRYSSKPKDWNYYAEVLDADGTVLSSVRNSWHKEVAVRDLAMLMGVTGRISVAIEL